MILIKIVKFGGNLQRYCKNKTVTFLAVKNTTTIAIKILQGSAVTQNALGGLFIRNLFATFLQYTSAKKYESRLSCVKVMSEDNVGPFYCDKV